MEVTELNLTHTKQAAPLLLVAWQEFAHNTELSDNDRFANSNAEQWLTKFLTEGSQGFVALDGKTVAGVITCSILDSPGYYRDPRHLLIIDVAVSEKYRRQGVGQLLEHRCEEFAKANGINLILGEIYAYNDASRQLMKRLNRKLGYEVWYKRFSDK